MPDGPVGVISQTADLLGFSHKTTSWVYKELFWKKEGNAAQQHWCGGKWLHWRSEESGRAGGRVGDDRKTTTSQPKDGWFKRAVFQIVD